MQEGLCCHGAGHGDGNRDGAANDVIPTSFYVDHLVLNSLFAFRNIFIGGFPSFYYLITANKIELFEIISRMLSQRRSVRLLRQPTHSHLRASESLIQESAALAISIK